MSVTALQFSAYDFSNKYQKYEIDSKWECCFIVKITKARKTVSDSFDFLNDFIYYE